MNTRLLFFIRPSLCLRCMTKSCQSKIDFVADIDECKIGNGRCEHKCINTDGSYYCMCKRGYKQAADGRRCRGNDTLIEATSFPKTE